MLLRSGLRLHFAPGTDLPARILVAKWGRNPSVNGDYTVGETTVRELPENMRRAGFDSIALDFEHNTVPSSPAYRAEAEPRKVAAHGALQVVPGEGVYFVPTTWTPEGRAAAAGGHYPDLSPAIVTNTAGEVVFIHSVALTRQGATEGLSLSLNSAGLGALAPTSTPPVSPTTPTMDYKKLLLLLLGLPETATDADIEAGAKAKATQMESATTAAKTATTAVQTMSATLDALTKRLDATERAAITAEALRLGKVIPQSATDLPLDKFRTLVGELPADQVPVERRTPEGLKLHAAAKPTDPEADAVRRQLGISEADWAKA